MQKNQEKWSTYASLCLKEDVKKSVLLFWDSANKIIYLKQNRQSLAEWKKFFTVYVNIWFHLYVRREKKRAGKTFVLNNSQTHPCNNHPVYQLLLDFPCFYKTNNICHNLFGCCSNPASIFSTAFMQYSEMNEEKMFSCWCRVHFCISFSYYLERITFHWKQTKD